MPARAWSVNRLTGAAAAARNSDPVPVVTTVPDGTVRLRLFYRATNNHLLQPYLVAGDTEWAVEDLTDSTDAPNLARNSDPVPITTTEPDGTEQLRVFYRTGGNQLRQPYLAEGADGWGDDGALNGVPRPANNARVVPIVVTEPDGTDQPGLAQPAGQLRLFYRDGKNQLRQPYLAGGDSRAAAGAGVWADDGALNVPDAAANSDPVPIITTVPDGTERVRLFYRDQRGGRNRLRQPYLVEGSGGWADDGVVSSIPAPAGNAKITTIETSLPDQEQRLRLFYRTGNNQLRQPYLAEGADDWGVDDLKGVPAPANNADPASIVVELTDGTEELRVVYRARNDHVLQLSAPGDDGNEWRVEDLTPVGGRAPKAADNADPAPIVTDLAGDRVLQVFYRTADSRIVQLIQSVS